MVGRDTCRSRGAARERLRPRPTAPQQSTDEVCVEARRRERMRAPSHVRLFGCQFRPEAILRRRRRRCGAKQRGEVELRREAQSRRAHGALAQRRLGRDRVAHDDVLAADEASARCPQGRTQSPSIRASSRCLLGAAGVDAGGRSGRRRRRSAYDLEGDRPAETGDLDRAREEPHLVAARRDLIFRRSWRAGGGTFAVAVRTVQSPR